MKKLLLIILMLLAFVCRGEDLTLQQAINIARVRSVNATSALNELRSAYWDYRSYRAELLPEVTFKATLPAYRKQYSSYQQSDGSYSFVRNDVLELSGELSLSQRIWPTGGTVALSTSLDYLRQLSGAKGNNFMSIPVALTLNQPIFAANHIKWNRRIEPVRYAEAKARFITATEEVAMTAIQYYFNVLIAREELANARQNLENAEKLYEVAKAKRKMGQISENDLLQIELTLLQARSSVSTNESNLKSYQFQLSAFLGYEEGTELQLEDPTRLPDISVDYAYAEALAQANNPFANNLKRRQLEADYEVAKARGAMREVTIFGQIGYTGADNDINGAYNRLKANQVVEIGVSIPILDWGKRRGAVKSAESRRQLVESTLRKEAMDFNSNLYVLVERFNNQRELLRMADRSAEIAVKRYETNVETFMVGRISTLDLNDSQTAKDRARVQQLQELFSYWYYFYQLRSLTLYDFATGQAIDADIEAALNM